jgi:malonyl-CoA O-methyltransferase
VGDFQQSTFDYFQKNYPKAQLWSDSFKSSIYVSIRDFFLRSNKAIRQYQIMDKTNSNEFDLVWIGSIKREKNTFHELFLQLEKCLKNNSLVMFNYLGPDTARETNLLQVQDGYIGPDMHDVGDLLTQSGFADPVMNMEYINLEYENSQILINDLTGLELITPSQSISKDFQDKVSNLLSSQAKFKLTLEVVYGHAWRIRKSDTQTIKMYPKGSFKSKKN